MIIRHLPYNAYGISRIVTLRQTTDNQINNKLHFLSH